MVDTTRLTLEIKQYISSLEEKDRQSQKIIESSQLEIAESQKIIESSQLEIAELKEKLALQLYRRFGRLAEKFNLNQPELFEEIEIKSDEQTKEEENQELWKLPLTKE